MFEPSSIEALVETIQKTPRVMAVGAGTKPRLSEVNNTFTRISMLGLRGIREYEPEEFVVTVLAGTPISEVLTVLDRAGQHLPFDPLLVRAGSTIGGAVAAGASGPGRFRFGGIRDFILGVQFVDGDGRLLRMGGKVVKNAAGFDLPKFMVGSLGRFGVLVEVTFKVFPRRPRSLTLQLGPGSIPAAVAILLEIGRARWEAEALELLPDGKVCVRLAGPEAALQELTREILKRWDGTQLHQSEAEQIWTGIREFEWAHARGVLAKFSITPRLVPEMLELATKLNEARVHISGGGNVAWLSLPASGEILKLDQALRRIGMTALTFRGPAPLWLGSRSDPAMVQSVKKALDAPGRFPNLED